MTDTSYQVVVTLSKPTVSALLKSGFYLYALKAVQSSDKAGRPIIWLRTQDYSTVITLSWSNQYQAFTSHTDIVPDKQIFAGFSADIILGQTLNVESGGIGEVISEGQPAAISFFNTTSDECTCGISQAIKGSSNPVCAFPLNGNSLQNIPPTEKVLLIFSTRSLDTGTVIERMECSGGGATSPGILIDFNDNPQREVSYDINNGWDWSSFEWARQITASSDLIPLLIEPF